jgi:hypothetical protein
MSSPFSPVQVNDAALQRVLDEDTRRTTALIDGATGQVIEETTAAPPGRFDSPYGNTGGFGPTVKLLEIEPFRLAPWMTQEVAEKELALQGKQRDE